MRLLLASLPLLAGCVTSRPHFIGLPPETPTEILRVEMKWRVVDKNAVSLTPDLPDIDVYRFVGFFPSGNPGSFKMK